MRFDKDLSAGLGKNINQTDQFLSKKYGEFYVDFVHRIIGRTDMNSLQILESLYKDKAYVDLNQEVQRVYPNLSQQETDLTQTFKYIKHYYPKAEVPKFIAFLSGFAYQTLIGDDYFGIGLDMFLGANHKFYGALTESLPRYQTRRFAPNYMTARITEYYVRENLIKERDEDKSLLAKMIYNGKVLYFLQNVLAEKTPDSVLIGYSSKQLDWAKAYEGNIWAYYLENNFLYETDYPKIQVFIADGPFTPGLGEKNNSAPRLGIFTGWQIVKKYMKLNPDVSITQLMTETDPQKILAKSKYKPREE